MLMELHQVIGFSDTVVVHAGDSGYTSNGYGADGFAARFAGGGRWAPSIKAFHIEHAAYDFLITLVFDKLFERFPNVTSIDVSQVLARVQTVVDRVANIVRFIVSPSPSLRASAADTERGIRRQVESQLGIKTPARARPFFQDRSP